jgi:hypothetical protein
MEAKTISEKRLVHYQATVIVDNFRRMTKEERLLLGYVFLDGCCAELPENIHISIDLLSRCSGFPEAKIVRLLGNLRSLGFSSKVRPHTNDGFLGSDPVVELSFHVMQMDYEGPDNSTIVLNEMMLGGADGYCSEHAIPLLERADFSQLASVTTKPDEHHGDGKSRRAPSHRVRDSRKL